MKKYLAFAYLVITLGGMLTAVAWLTRNGCMYTDPLSEERGSHLSGLCVGDGSQFVGVILESVVVAITYVLVTRLVFRFLGFRIVKNRGSRP